MSPERLAELEKLSAPRYGISLREDGGNELILSKQALTPELSEALKEIRELQQLLAAKQSAWRNSIATVLQDPKEIELIGKDEHGEIRKALRPVAEALVELRRLHELLGIQVIRTQLDSLVDRVVNRDPKDDGVERDCRRMLPSLAMWIRQLQRSNNDVVKPVRGVEPRDENSERAILDSALLDLWKEFSKEFPRALQQDTTVGQFMTWSLRRLGMAEEAKS